MKGQPENGICVKSWYGDKNDKVLFNLAKELARIPETNAKSVYEIVKDIQNRNIG